MSIVLELQKEATNSDKDIVTVLKMALMVSYKLNLNDFEEWVGKELGGYQEEDIVPTYRKVSGMLEYYEDEHYHWSEFMFNTYEKEIYFSTSNISYSIFYLNNITSIDEGNLKINISRQIREELFEGNCNVTLRNNISRSTIENIIEQVRTEILKWALMLERNDILGSELTFSQSEIDIARTNPQIINYVNTTIINGNITDSQVQQGSDGSTQAKISQLED